MTRKNYIPLYDILKALGIISIVIDHCTPIPQAGIFVYSYHLTLFFFVGGLQFQHEKYASQPFLLLQNRAKNLWPGYFCYLSFFTVTHDLFLSLHLLPGDEVAYGITNTGIRLVNNFVLSGEETLGGALWFVPVFLVAFMLFSFALWFSGTFFPKLRTVVLSGICFAIGMVGIYFCMRGFCLVQNIQISLVMVPMILAGYCISLKKIDYSKILRWYVALPCIALVCWLLFFKRYQIELSANLIGSPLVFYPISLCGIYFISYLAKVLSRSRPLQKLLTFIGKYSFDIMALHFFIFKLIDFVIGRLTQANPAIYSTFPKAFPALFPLYLIAGVGLPPFIRIGISKCYQKLKQFIQSKASANTAA